MSSREVREAFDFMAGGQEELSQADVMEFMEAKFRPMGLGSLIPRDASTLVGKEPMTLERLTKMLLNNQLGAEADPTAAVFKCLANKSSGFISVETLKNLLQSKRSRPMKGITNHLLPLKPHLHLKVKEKPNPLKVTTSL